MDLVLWGKFKGWHYVVSYDSKRKIIAFNHNWDLLTRKTYVDINRLSIVSDKRNFYEYNTFDRQLEVNLSDYR